LVLLRSRLGKHSSISMTPNVHSSASAFKNKPPFLFEVGHEHPPNYPITFPKIPLTNIVASGLILVPNLPMALVALDSVITVWEPNKTVSSQSVGGGIHYYLPKRHTRVIHLLRYRPRPHFGVSAPFTGCGSLYMPPISLFAER